MEKHSDSKKYVKWSLENTAIILSEQFPRSHIFVVRPSRYRNDTHRNISIFLLK